jgi:sulfide:quinone oxidoreductase
MTAARATRPRRPRVLIVGGGVAGLETLLALRALVGDRLDISVVAPRLKFLNESMSVREPFTPQRVRGVRIEDMLAELDARWIRADLDCVRPEEHVALTRRSERLPYDRLVLALGARPAVWHSRSLAYRDPSRPLVYSGTHDNSDYRLLLDHIAHGRVRKLAFVKPAGPSWPLPLYDLALTTAAELAVHGRGGTDLHLVTPEEEPLGVFGRRASEVVRGLLEESGVTLHTASYCEPRAAGWLDVSPGDRRIEVDRVVTEPRLAGPRVRGLPCDGDGFIHTDAHGRLPDLEDVYAAGDATAFPVKQGGLAAQQADAVAEAIAESVGVDIDPQPFRPVLRGVLLTGGLPRYLRSDISGGTGDDSDISSRALWWPPNKLAGRYLAPYLSSQLGETADVMPQEAHGVQIEHQLDSHASDQWPVLADLPRPKPA